MNEMLKIHHVSYHWYVPMTLINVPSLTCFLRNPYRYLFIIFLFVNYFFLSIISHGKEANNNNNKKRVNLDNELKGIFMPKLI